MRVDPYIMDIWLDLLFYQQGNWRHPHYVFFNFA